MTMKIARTTLVTLSAAVIAAAAVIGGYTVYKSLSKPPAAPQRVERKITRVKKIDRDVTKISVPRSARPEGIDFQKVPKLPDNLPDPGDLREQFRLLKTILELPPERLAKIRISIEKIEAMPAEQKQRMLSMIPDRDSNASIAEREAHAEELLAAMPSDMRSLITFRTKSFTKERRAAFIEGYAAACEDTLKESLRNNAGPVGK